MSVASAALALPRTVKLKDDREVTLAPLTYEGAAKFSLWLEEKSWTGMMRAAQRDGDLKGWQQAHLALVATGEFEPGSQTFSKATTTESGNRYLIELMLQEKDAEDLAYEIAADNDDLQAVMRIVQELNSDPLAVRERKIPPKAPSKGQSR